MKRGRKEIDYTPVRVCFSLHPSQVDGVKQLVKDYRKQTPINDSIFCSCSQGRGTDIDQRGFAYCIDCQKNLLTK